MKQLIETLQIALKQAQANLHTSTIGRVVKVNSKTVDIQPVINRKVDGKDIKLPVFVEVPVMHLHGGASYTAYPVNVGDYALLIFTERCFDNWYNGIDEALPLEFRMHDYSDAVAIVGLYNRAGEITIPSVITHIGDVYEEGNHEHIGDVEQTGNYVMTGDFTQTGNMTINGNVQVNGNIVCTGNISAGSFSGLNGGAMTSAVDIVSNGISLQNHTHTEHDGYETGTTN